MKFRQLLASIGGWAKARPNGGSGAVESRVELSARYTRELLELVDDRQISAALASEILDDLFEPEAIGIARRVRMDVWHAYVEDRADHIDRLVLGHHEFPDAKDQF